jgi:hypothetical protein
MDYTGTVLTRHYHSLLLNKKTLAVEVSNNHDRAPRSAFGQEKMGAYNFAKCRKSAGSWQKHERPRSSLACLESTTQGCFFDRQICGGFGDCRSRSTEVLHPEEVQALVEFVLRRRSFQKFSTVQYRMRLPAVTRFSLIIRPSSCPACPNE